MSGAASGERAPRLSVVICTRDRPRLLAEALDSLAGQTLDRELWEVVVVDNGEGPETRRLLERLAEHQTRRLPNARWVREERVGLSHARNRGFRAASGEWVGYTDDDCRLPPGWLATALEIAERERPDVFGGPYRPHYESRKPAWFEDRWGASDQGSEPRLLEPGEWLPGGNLFLRRARLIELGGFDGRLGMAGRRVGYAEESALLDRLRAVVPEARIHYDPRLWVSHLVRPEKMTVRWRLAASFGKGRSAVLAGHEPPSSRGRLALAGRLLSTIAAAALDASLGMTRRDRQRYPSARGYLYERTARYFRTLGTLWAALHEESHRAPGGGEGSAPGCTPGRRSAHTASEETAES